MKKSYRGNGSQDREKDMLGFEGYVYYGDYQGWDG